MSKASKTSTGQKGEDVDGLLLSPCGRLHLPSPGYFKPAAPD